MSIQSVVRTNIDRDNHDSNGQMLIDLKSLNIDGLVTDFAVRFETPCDKYHSNVSVADNKTVSNYIKECMYLSKRIGIPHSRRYASDTPCLAIVPRQFVIDPVGDLYKCAAFAGEKAYSVGSIYDEQMYDVYVDMVGHDAWQDCRDCPYVPLCGGGCLFLNRTATGNFKTRKCQRTLFESLVMETIASTLNVEDLQKRIEEVNNG